MEYPTLYDLCVFKGAVIEAKQKKKRTGSPPVL